MRWAHHQIALQAWPGGRSPSVCCQYENPPVSELTNDPQSLWTNVLLHLRRQMDPSIYDTWLDGSIGLTLSDDLLTIGVFTPQAVDSITNRLQHVVDDAARRVYGRPLGTVFTVVQRSKPKPYPAPGPRSQPKPRPRPKPSAPITRTDPAPAQTPDAPSEPADVVELENYDPTERGWVKVPNYAIRFWQPYLTSFPFHLWVALRSFAFSAHRVAWPSVETLADICVGGNRHRILGRAAHKGCRRPTVGALAVLEQHNIVHVLSRGEGRSTMYAYRVLDTLPLLTPTQVRTLSTRLQDAHERFMRQAELDLAAWSQLTTPTFISPHALGQTRPQRIRPNHVEGGGAEGLFVPVASLSESSS